MSKNHEKSLVFATILSVLVAGLDLYLSRRTGMLIFHALIPFAIAAAWICALVFIRMRLARRSHSERRDESLAQGERADTSLFEADSDDAPLTIERSRRQFEQVVVPAATVFLIVAEALWGLWLFRKIQLGALSAVASEELLATTFLFGQGFVLFLFSRYLTGLGREKRLRLYRGPGISTGVASLVSFAGGLATLLAIPFQAQAIVLASYVLTAVLLVLTVESLLMLIVAFYSPRRKFLTRVAYESRLANFLTDPAQMARNVAHTVDYQFGLDVSQHWYSRVLKSTVVPLVSTAGILVYLLTSLVVLGPEEQGILEHYGRPVDDGWLLDSGFHVKKPWPFETIKRIPAKRIQRVDLGFIPEDDAHADDANVLVWTRPHYKEESRFLVFNPLAGAEGQTRSPSTTTSTLVGFLNANIPLQYEVKDLKAYAYNYANPREMVEKTAIRVLTQEMASRTLRDLLVADRSAVSADLKRGMQQEFDRLRLGVEVRFVGIYSLHPPMEVAPAYEGVVDAIAGKEQRILEARTYEEKILPQARAESETLVQQATSYMMERKALAAAEATHFEKRLLAYETGGDVYKHREYLATLRSSLKGVRKFVVQSGDGHDVIDFKGSSGVDIPTMLLDKELKANR